MFDPIGLGLVERRFNFPDTAHHCGEIVRLQREMMIRTVLGAVHGHILFDHPRAERHRCHGHGNFQRMVGIAGWNAKFVRNQPDHAEIAVGEVDRVIGNAMQAADSRIARVANAVQSGPDIIQRHRSR